MSIEKTEESLKLAPQLVTIPDTAVYTLKANHIGSEFRIEIALPSDYEQSKQSYPVIYLTDGNWFFPIVVGNVRNLLVGPELPQPIIVGIGYQTESSQAIRRLRMRDLTPPTDEKWLELVRKGPLAPHLEGIDPEGAEKFIAFIDHELKPFMNSHYRTRPDNETLIGHSGGGLFAFYVLMTHTDSFDKYIIGDPPFLWDQGASYKYEENYSKTNKDLPKKVFLSICTPDEMHDKMVNRLTKRKYPSLDIGHHTFEGETHLSVVGTAINRGLRFVFKNEIPEQSKSN